MEAKPLKVVYLFGAGATSAELMELEGEGSTEDVALTIGDVSRRVLLKFKSGERIPKNLKVFLENTENADIELFISFIESNYYAFKNAAKIVDRLKALVEEDIKSVLTPKRMDKFFLHKALLELHHNNNKENVLGFISLNYDTVLDTAYREYYGKPDYSFSFPKKNTKTTQASFTQAPWVF